MTDFQEHIASLTREKGRLSAELSREETYLAFVRAEVAAAVAGADASAAEEVARLRDMLGANPLFQQLERVSAAIAILSGPATARPAPRPHVPAAREPAVVPERTAARVPRIDDTAPLRDPSLAARVPAGPREPPKISAAPPQSEHRPPADSGPDDLTDIRGIDRATAATLARHGVSRIAEIAAWTAADVRSVAAALSLDRRIATENWIEQAALLLARRNSTAPQPRSGSSAAPLPAPIVVETPDAPPPPALFDAPPAAEEPPRPSLTAVAAIMATRRADHVSDATRAILDRLSTFELSLPKLPQLTLPPVAELPPDPVAVAVPPPAPAPAAEPDPAPPPAAIRAVPSDHVSVATKAILARLATFEVTVPRPARAAEPAPAPVEQPVPAATLLAADPPPANDLSRLAGLDGDAIARLVEAGVVHYAAIGRWTAADVAHWRTRGLARALTRHSLVEQAALLATGASTAYAARLSRGEGAILVAPPRADFVPKPALRARLDALLAPPPAAAVANFAPMPIDAPVAAAPAPVLDEPIPAIEDDELIAFPGDVGEAAVEIVKRRAIGLDPTIEDEFYRDDGGAEPGAFDWQPQAGATMRTTLGERLKIGPGSRRYEARAYTGTPGDRLAEATVEIVRRDAAGEPASPKSGMPDDAKPGWKSLLKGLGRR